MSLGRKNAIVFGAALVAVAAWFVVEGILRLRLVDRLKEARPVDAAVDFSKPGDVTADFRQISGASHNQVLLLELPGRTDDNLSRLAEGLRFRATLALRDDGRTVTREYDGKAPLGDAGGPGAVLLWNFPPPHIDNYTLALRVTEGALALAGLPQRLVMRYEICGLEYFPAQIAILLGIVLGLIGGVTILLALHGRPRLPKAA